MHGSRGDSPAPTIAPGMDAAGNLPGLDATVLCVFLDVPLGDSALSIRSRRLAAIASGLGRSIAVVVLDATDEQQAWLARDIGAEVHVLRAGKRARWRGITSAVVRPWRSWPPTRTNVANARASLTTLLDGAEPEIVWCAGAETFLALPKRLRSRAIVDYVDLPSRNRRELARVAAHRVGRRITHDGGVDASVFELAREVQGGIRNRMVERYVGRKASAVIVASPTEVRDGVHCVRTGVDDPGIVAPPRDPFPVAHFVFPGSFHYPPHQDAAEWFALYVLPPLRQLLPNCRVQFAGEHPDWLQSFGDMHGIEVTGPADVQHEPLDARSVVIAPIRSGSGTVIEVIDAWARGVPVVATSRAVEGLQPTDGEDVLIADDPAEFAARCSMAARYPELRAKLAGNGRARYESEFTWPGIGAGLRTLLESRRQRV